MRLSEAFHSAANLEVADGEFLLTCTCGFEQRLDTMELDAEPDLVLYDCSRCATSLVAIMPLNADTERLMASVAMTGGLQEVGGHRRNGFLFGSRVDVAWQPVDAQEAEALIPATPTFFNALRYL
jgi:hypothetical protein